MSVPSANFGSPSQRDARHPEALRFLVQFRRSRRGFPEVIAEMLVEGPSAAAILDRLRTPLGISSWPLRTDSVRVLDSRGRRLLEWMQPTVDAVH